MEDEQNLVLAEKQEAGTSQNVSLATGGSTINAMEEETQESDAMPEKTSLTEDKTNEDNGVEGVHQRDEQTVPTQTEAQNSGKVIKQNAEKGDTLTSNEDAAEDSSVLDGEESGAGPNKEGSSAQEENASDLSNHKAGKCEAIVISQELPAATDVDDRSKEEQNQPITKDNSDEADIGKPVASSTKDGMTVTESKEEWDRKSEIPHSRTRPKSYGRATRKDITEKFGGVATSGVLVKRSTSCGAGAVKNMLLEWCRAKTRGREVALTGLLHLLLQNIRNSGGSPSESKAKRASGRSCTWGVDIQNFSSSWSNGLAFCALILAFFPDAFDYDSLDSKNRKENFQLAFNAAEKFADCPPLLDVEDMVRMRVPDSKCVYTYVQELYRSLVAKGLVKTKKT